MLYTFKSKAAGDVIMLQANGRAVLGILGKDDSPTGIVLPEDISAAMQALKTAVAQEEAAQQAAVAEAKSLGAAAPRFEAIGLRQRTQSLMKLLDRSLAGNVAVTWGV